MTAGKHETKLVEIRLSALTRMEYTEIAKVPANISEGELNDLVNERYRLIDAGEFSPDPEYWERGACYASGDDIDSDAEPSVVVSRTGNGLIVQGVEVEESGA